MQGVSKKVGFAIRAFLRCLEASDQKSLEADPHLNLILHARKTFSLI